MMPDFEPTRRRVLLAAIIVLGTAIAYLPAMRSGYIWDDNNYLTTNPWLDDFAGLRQLWTPGSTKQYYPLVFTTFWIEKHLWDLEPAGYHVVNVALHVTAALLLWRLMWRLGIPEGRAWMVAAVFAFHPVHVESVAWITERKNVLSACLYLSAALCYLRFLSPSLSPRERAGVRVGVEREAPSVGGGRVPSPPAPLPRGEGGNWGWYIATILLFIGALLSKSVTCSLPAALILAHLYLRQRITATRLALLTPMFVIGLVMALHTAHLETENVGAVGPEFNLSFADRLLIASRAMLFYPAKLLAPWPLIFIYPRWTINDRDLASYWSVLVVGLIAMTAAAVYFKGRDRGRGRGPALALAYYAGTIFPALGFLNVYPMRYSFVADHFQYLASIGIIALFVVGAGELIRSAQLRTALATLVLVAFGAITSIACLKYHDAETLWRWTTDENPGAWMAHNNLGMLLRLKGDNEAAIEHFQAALDLNPDHYEARSNLADSLRLEGRYDDSLEQLRLARESFIKRYGRVNPEDECRIGMTLEQAGRVDEAIEHYRTAVTLDEHYTDAHFRLAVIAAKAQRLDEAASHFQSVLEMDENNLTANVFLAQRDRLAGRYDQVERRYRRALAGATRNEDRISVLYKLAWFLATCADDRHRNGAESLRLATELANAVTPAYSLDLKAAVDAEAGRFDDAAAKAATALTLARQTGEDVLAEQIQQRLTAYQAGRPWRE